MRRRNIAAAAAAAAAAALVPAIVYADSCANVSRAPAACGTNCTDGPVIQGNWVWLPSVEPGAPPVWGFAPPGAADSVGFGFPGANGNYTNGYSGSLLGRSVHCTSNDPSSRQQTHGIQTGCTQ